MGLFGMVKELASTLGNMKNMSGELEKIEHQLDQLVAGGKCPPAVAEALKKFEDMEAEAKNGGKSLSAEDSMKGMADFAKVLEANKDKLPEDITKLVDEFESGFGKLSEIAGKFK